MISEDKIQDGDRISNLIYAKAEGLPEGLVSDKIYQTKTMLHISEDTINTSNDTSIVITSQFAHYCLLMQRVYAQTESSVFLEGPHGSGKSTLMDTYRRLNRSNTAYLRVSLNRKENSMTFNKRLSTMIQQHSLTHVKAKVNYQETMIIIDDCSLADEDKIARLKLIKLIH